MNESEQNESKRLIYAQKIPSGISHSIVALYKLLWLAKLKVTGLAAHCKLDRLHLKHLFVYAIKRNNLLWIDPSFRQFFDGSRVSVAANP